MLLNLTHWTLTTLYLQLNRDRNTLMYIRRVDLGPLLIDLAEFALPVSCYVIIISLAFYKADNYITPPSPQMFLFHIHSTDRLLVSGLMFIDIKSNKAGYTWLPLLGAIATVCVCILLFKFEFGHNFPFFMGSIQLVTPRRGTLLWVFASQSMKYIS